VEGERFAKDKIVQLTDQDASVSRLSAVEVGYLDDPFARLFLSAGQQKKFPIINRGMSVIPRATNSHDTKKRQRHVCPDHSYR